ncbi:retrovirus-related pol polyprotein from transposon TNT 1-94, partial [Tanacetum coccineum]
MERPQQNGRVERRHINIFKIARALRLHAHLPIHYWGDCVITTTYLINRFPTSVLKFKTPYEVLLNSKPVCEHLRVFGCLAMASNPSRVADKFEARGVPCLFLGYPQHQNVAPFSNALVPEPNLAQASTSMLEQTTSSDDYVPEPEFESVLVPNTPIQPEVTRKSSRVP